MIGFDSLVRWATTEPRKYARNRQRNQKYKVEYEMTTQRLTWKTHNSGKNHDNPRTIEYTIWEKYKVEENTEATTSCLLLQHTWRRLQDGGNDLSLSLSLSLSVTHSVQIFYNNYQHVHKICALSHIYTYMTFRHIYICVLPIGRNRSGPVLGSAGSLCHPSGGICFPTITTIVVQEPGLQFIPHDHHSRLLIFTLNNNSSRAKTWTSI